MAHPLDFKSISKHLGPQNACTLQTIVDTSSLILHPSWAEDVLLGVKHELDKKILKLHPKYGGVVLDYSGVTIQGRHGKILSGINPYFRLQISTTFRFFSPKIGDILTGVVNAIGHDFLGIVVLGVFNASIAEESLNGFWTYSETSSFKPQWVSVANDKHTLIQGDKVLFALTSVHAVDGEYLGMHGSLNDTSTGNYEFVTDAASRKATMGTIDVNEDHKGEKKRKKPKKHIEEGTSVEPPMEDAGVGGGEHSGKKKKKRRKVYDDKDEGEKAELLHNVVPENFVLAWNSKKWGKKPPVEPDACVSGNETSEKKKKKRGGRAEATISKIASINSNGSRTVGAGDDVKKIKKRKSTS